MLSCVRLFAAPLDGSPPGFPVHGILQARILEFLLQGIFPTQGSNPGLLHCRWILYQLSHQGSPRILEWVVYPFSSVIFPTQELNWGLLHCRQILLPTELSGKPCPTKQSLKYSFEEQIVPKPTFNPTNVNSSLKTPGSSPQRPSPPGYFHLLLPLTPGRGGSYW